MVSFVVIGGPHNGAPFIPLQKATERVKQVRHEFVEAAAQRKETHRQEMRAIARQREDEKRAAKRAARRQYYDEVDAAYAERFAIARREREQYVHSMGKRSRIEVRTA